MLCTFRYDDARHLERFECASARGPQRRWGWQLGGAFMQDAALARQGDTVYLARFSDIATGCEVRAFRADTGRELWRTRLSGVGPIAHSEYLNHVQIRVVDGRPVVFGWESAGRYVEILDAETGRTLSNRRSADGAAWQAGEIPPAPPPPPAPPSPGAAADVPWQWSGAPLGPGSQHDATPVTIAQPGGGRCVFSFDATAKTTHLGCTDRPGVEWARDEGDHILAAAALAVAGDALVVVSFIPMASGATATAYERATGRERWRTGLHGIGRVSHSGYLNDVRVRVAGDRVVVTGWEASGRYVEVVDLASGRILGTRLATEAP